MENYTITKKQILELHESNSYETRIQIAKMFPEAFKTELVIGKWYIASCYKTNEYLILATEIIGNNEVKSNCWFTPWKSFTNTMGLFDKTERLATPEEVKSALINEAKKRGFIEGAKHNITNGSKTINATDNRFAFLERENKLLFNNWSIFEQGIWAEILPQEKTVVPMEKALKIIAKKMKVSPENIEIQS